MQYTHIIFILTDQMRADAIGQATPNLNSLAQRGVRFENSYCAAPLCSPSRNSIVCGKHPTGHGVCGNMGEVISAEERADTYPQHLQSSGYHTAYIGKHHYVDRYGLGVDLIDDDPLIKSFGYDHVWQVGDVAEAKHNADRFTQHLKSKGKLDNWREKVSKTYVAESESADTTDGYIGNCAIDYLENYDFDSQPLFLNVGFVGPHGPYWSPEPYASQFDPALVAAPYDVQQQSTTTLYDAADLAKEKEMAQTISQYREQRAAYLGMIAFIDSLIGQIVETLQQRDVLEQTLIVFTSDHGNMLGDHGLAGKRYYFEQSVRVPLILAGSKISLDERVGSGIGIQRELVSSVDLYPTFLDAAGLDPVTSEREGISLLRLIAEETTSRRAVFSELGTTMMVRDANWKLVYDPEQGGVQYLFNLRVDPHEEYNLAGEPTYRTIEANLVELLLNRLIKLTHYTHAKERTNLQRVRV